MNVTIAFFLFSVIERLNHANLIGIMGYWKPFLLPNLPFRFNFRFD